MLVDLLQYCIFYHWMIIKKKVKTSGNSYDWWSHLHQCVLTVSVKTIPFGVKGLIVAVSVNLTFPRTGLVETVPLTHIAGAARWVNAIKTLEHKEEEEQLRGRGRTQMTTRFCSWWWRSDRRERLSHCTCRCSSRQVRSLLCGLRSDCVGSSIRCYSLSHCSEVKH